MRKSDIVTITSDGRDKGKRFMIVEMPAMKAERWALRALLALAHAGVDIGGDEGRSQGMAGLARAGLKAMHELDFSEAEPLLNEMWDCVLVIPDPKTPEFTRKLVRNDAEGDDIEEVSTIWELRQRVFALHTDFFFAANESKKASGSR